MLAGLCYLGSAVGLAAYLFARALFSPPPRAPLTPPRGREAPLSKGDLPWLAGSALSGGILAPILLFSGLKLCSASYASILMNCEAILTALLAYLFFRESAGKKLWLSAILITAGAGVLSWDSSALRLSFEPGMIMILLACLMWALDNNLTGRISAKDPAMIALIKGFCAGSVNVAAAFLTGDALPGIAIICAGLILGAAGYGFSLIFFIRALREAGAARTAVIFGAYPFIGAGVSVLALGEPFSARLAVSSAFMASAFLSLASEKHSHAHRHERLNHDHLHAHDEHHRHGHGGQEEEFHSHPHAHDEQTHTHPHSPDIHHKH